MPCVVAVYRWLLALESGDKVLVTAENEQVGQDGFIILQALFKTTQGIEKQVYPFVTEFIASGNGHNLRITGKFFS